ncbi:MAG TPA: alpha-L-rhamnosidase N-terminal domain-containing protein, partial [Tepidisphaeraceae bacterium]|nr:alpha-L-rhamnosidase N-terminal domain-containing protein [Tepidisphaeraceae bacterium]
MKDWSAYWVWQQTSDPASPNTYVYFRRSWQQPAPVDRARVRVSADTYYRLFINGRLVGWGPPMSEPRWQRYDEYDAAPFLRRGTNVIGAIVYHYGNGRYNPEGNTFYWSRGGFICQLDLPGQRIQTDSSWL